MFQQYLSVLKPQFETIGGNSPGLGLWPSVSAVNPEQGQRNNYFHYFLLLKQFFWKGWDGEGKAFVIIPMQDRFMWDVFSFFRNYVESLWWESHLLFLVVHSIWGPEGCKSSWEISGKENSTHFLSNNTCKFFLMSIVWSLDFHLFVLGVSTLKAIMNIMKQSLFWK